MIESESKIFSLVNGLGIKMSLVLTQSDISFMAQLYPKGINKLFIPYVRLLVSICLPPVREEAINEFIAVYKTIDGIVFALLEDDVHKIRHPPVASAHRFHFDLFDLAGSDKSEINSFNSASEFSICC